MSIYMSLEVRLTGTCWEGWVTISDWEVGEVNTLGCCFCWTFPPGAVVTASPSLKMYDGTACTVYRKKPSNWPKGAQTLLFRFFNIYFPFLLLFGPHLSNLLPGQVWTKWLMSTQTDCRLLHTWRWGTLLQTETGRDEHCDLHNSLLNRQC